MKSPRSLAATCLLLLSFVAGPAPAGVGAPAAAEIPHAGFPFLARTPYPMQHADPRASDFVDLDAPGRLEPAWSALTDSTVAQPCSSGERGAVYCTLGWDRASNRCNLRALDAATGEQLWEDRVEGRCVLDEAALLTNPLVDLDGNLYVADSGQIASFTADGRPRWTNPVPARLPSPAGLPNPPFGISMLPTGELVTATIGDGFVLVVDRATGELVAPPLDLPSAKRASGAPRPPGFMETLASPAAADLLWAIALGGSGYEVDNNVAVDPRSGLVFLTGGAPAPNPENRGALWAVRFDGSALAVAFHVELAGTGGIATTPTVTADGEFVLIGDNRHNLVAVDIPACAALAPGSACSAFGAAPLGEQLGASVIATPGNRIVFPQPNAGLRAFDVERDALGAVALREAWTHALDGRTASSVATGFRDVAFVAASDFTTGVHQLVAVDIAHGRRIGSWPAGDLANLTVASDPAWLLTNNINFTDELAGRHGPAGVWGWRASRDPAPQSRPRHLPGLRRRAGDAVRGAVRP